MTDREVINALNQGLKVEAVDPAKSLVIVMQITTNGK